MFSGNRQTFTKIKENDNGFPNMLKVACPDRSDLNLFLCLSYKSFYVRMKLIPKHMSHAVVSPTTNLQTGAGIPEIYLRNILTRSSTIPRHTPIRKRTSMQPPPKRMRVKRECMSIQTKRRKKIQCGGGGGSGPKAGRATPSQMSTVTSRLTIKITQSKVHVSTSTSTYPKLTPSSTPFTASSSVKMDTATASTPCSAGMSTSSFTSSQHSLGTVLAMSTTSHQTTTTQRKSSIASEMTETSPTLEHYVSSSLKETTPRYKTKPAFNLKTSFKITTRTAGTETANTTIRQSTTPFETTKATTPRLPPVNLLVKQTPRVLTTTGIAAPETGTTIAPMDAIIALHNAEQVSAGGFFDDSLHVALVSILAGFTAIGTTVGLISYVRAKIAGSENNR